MKCQLDDIHDKPGHPAIPFLKGVESLGNKHQNGQAGIQIGMRVHREEPVKQHAPNGGRHEHRRHSDDPPHGGKGGYLMNHTDRYRINVFKVFVICFKKMTNIAMVNFTV